MPPNIDIADQGYREAKRSKNTAKKYVGEIHTTPVFLNPFCLGGTLGQQYHFLTVPLDAKLSLKVNEDDNLRHPWNYRTALRFAFIGLVEIDKRSTFISLFNFLLPTDKENDGLLHGREKVKTFFILL